MNSVIVIDAKDDLSNKNITGLVANKIASKYKKPVILFSSCGKDIYTGSARGLGHPNAYGVGIKESNLSVVISELNNRLANYSFEDCLIVDFDIHANRVEENFIYSIHRNGNIWGKGIEEPLILWSRVTISLLESAF
ncbi:hypothetical protein [Brevibacillus laterosporus]|uniref:hypothetical protein n=1 Tax=Brevibacillus laterosporus TaxID=1465 RepID=UPI003D1AF51A